MESRGLRRATPYMLRLPVLAPPARLFIHRRDPSDEQRWLFAPNAIYQPLTCSLDLDRCRARHPPRPRAHLGNTWLAHPVLNLPDEDA